MRLRTSHCDPSVPSPGTARVEHWTPPQISPAPWCTGPAPPLLSAACTAAAGLSVHRFPCTGPGPGLPSRSLAAGSPPRYGARWEDRSRQAPDPRLWHLSEALTECERGEGSADVGNEGGNLRTGERYSFGWVQATGPGPARECGTCAEFGRGPPMSTARTKEAPHTASAPSEAWRLIVTANLLARWCCILHPSPGPACVGHPRRVIACPRRPVPSLPAHGRSSIQGSVHEHPGPHIPAWRRPMGARMAVLRSRAGRRSGLRGSRACSAGRGASSPQTGRIGGVRVGTHAREPMCLRCLQASCVPPGREPPAGLPFARERPLCSARLPIPKTHARARARTCIPETCFESGPGAGRRAATAAPPSPATRGWSLRRARACAW